MSCLPPTSTWCRWRRPPDRTAATGSSPAATPITVSVPFGGVGNETLVTYTNGVNTGEFKICKTSSATADGSGLLLAGDTFWYTYSYTVDGVTTVGTTSVTIPTNAVPGLSDLHRPLRTAPG